MPPLVSVIITTYNQIAFLPQAIDSVRTQTCQDREIIVVDDASGDDTQDYLRSQFDLRCILSPSNGGASAARNKGLRAAGGKYIVLLDGDDLLGPKHLEILVRPLDNDPSIGVAFGEAQFCDPAGQDLPWRFSDLCRPYPGPDVFEALSYGNFIALHAAMTRRTCLEAMGGEFDESMHFGEDWQWWLRLGAACQVRYLPEVVARYRVHPTSYSRRRVNLTGGNAFVRQWLIASPLFARLSPRAQYACYLSAAISLAKLGERDEARHLLARARHLRPLHPAAHLMMVMTGLSTQHFATLADSWRELSNRLRHIPQPWRYVERRAKTADAPIGLHNS